MSEMSYPTRFVIEPKNFIDIDKIFSCENFDKS